ncbi:hypothetical protein UUU_35190 [Klebsiella pneumoniae subsp. pneumoniae DSM 30104 = JCM 1662 = NBRC 14940]|nr:hypothetical protein UUU_35190 [Klebsiella pneumoniae subsp. pneumoniae DSM 30104 = JCM 1662 = NBRC 14940]
MTGREILLEVISTADIVASLNLIGIYLHPGKSYIRHPPPSPAPL